MALDEWTLDLTDEQVEQLREQFLEEQAQELESEPDPVMTLNRDQLVTMLSDMDRVGGHAVRFRVPADEPEKVQPEAFFAGWTPLGFDFERLVTDLGASQYIGGWPGHYGRPESQTC